MKKVALFVVILTVIALLVPTLSLAGDRYYSGRGMYRGGHGHPGGGYYRHGGGYPLGEALLGTAIGVLVGGLIYNAFTSPPYYPPPSCYERVEIYHWEYDQRTRQSYRIFDGWRDVSVPCR